MNEYDSHIIQLEIKNYLKEHKNEKDLLTREYLAGKIVGMTDIYFRLSKDKIFMEYVEIKLREER